MSKTLVITATLGLVGAASLVRADAPMVHCECAAGGGSGPTRYAYRVDSGSYPVMEFRVGTNDLERANYAAVMVPEGWSFDVEPNGAGHACGVRTPHGEVSSGPCFGLTLGTAVWSTKDPALAIEFFTFGYDHPWNCEDVGWTLETRREGPPPTYYTFHEHWDVAVGTGYGPLHGPVPEPSTLALLAGGGLCLAAYARRRRRGRPQSNSRVFNP